MHLWKGGGLGVVNIFTSWSCARNRLQQLWLTLLPKLDRPLRFLVPFHIKQIIYLTRWGYFLLIMVRIFEKLSIFTTIFTAIDFSHPYESNGAKLFPSLATGLQKFQKILCHFIFEKSQLGWNSLRREPF